MTQAVPNMLIGNTPAEGAIADKDQMQVMYYSGYMGWSIYGALSVFNVLYYMDVYKRQYMENDHSSWDRMAFWTIQGAASWIRLHINIVGWFVMSFFWALSIGGWTWPVLHTFFHGFTEVFIVIWAVRVFFLLIMQVLALMLDNHGLTHAVFNYYQHGHAYGAEMKIGDLYDAVDIELEAFNILAQGTAFALYSIGQPLFQAQIDKNRNIMREGASCQLCFKKRQSNTNAANTDGTANDAQMADWSKSCERIRVECERNARAEAAKIANRTVRSQQRDPLNFMF